MNTCTTNGMNVLSYIFLYLQLSIFSIKFHLKILVTVAVATQLLCIIAHENNLRQQHPKILITLFHTKLKSQRHVGFENKYYMSILPFKVTN